MRRHLVRAAPYAITAVVVGAILYRYPLDRIAAENEALAATNEALAAQIERGLDAATVERVAREQYGMRRPGERVYRVESTDPE